MPWNTPTADDVLGEFTPDEKASLNVIQGGDSQLVDILQKAVASARGSILAGGNELGQDGTLPDQVIPDVLAIVRWRWLVSFPALKKLQTEERKGAYNDGIKSLREIAGGHPKVERPDQPIQTTGSLVTLPAVEGRCRHFTKRSEDGI